MRVAIIGPGAMGSLFGAMLSSRADVVLIGRSPDHIAAIQRGGLALEHMDGSRTRYSLSATIDPAAVAGTADLVVVFTKSHHTREAAQTARKVLNREGLALTLQNGVGNYEILSGTVGEAGTIAGVTSHGATFLNPGIVRHAGTGTTQIGRCRERRGLQEEVVALFNDSGIETAVSDNVDSLIWGKLLINVGINALTAILRVPNGALRDSPVCEKIMAGAISEAVDVAGALGIPLPYEDPLTHVKTVCQNTARNRASMLQDILKSSRTEVDVINGAVVDMGGKLGIPTPFNSMLTDIVLAMDATASERIREA